MGLYRDQHSLIPVADLPQPFRSTFNFRYFNSLQSECFSGCFLSDINMVISAPTASGKTVLFELCILRLMSKFLSSEGKFNHKKGTLKTIYIAPSKALVQEKLRDWCMKFHSLAIKCLEMTGDNESYKAENIQEADIILTTPEKFDAVTRHGARNGDLSFFSDIALVLIDEVHFLNDPRGATLEAIISRIKMLSRISEMRSSPLAYVRFLAVSATIPNIQDIAEWLSVPAQGIKRFGEEMRPVQLMTKVFGYAPAKNDFLFERRLQNFIFDILMQYSRGKSALIFCSTRKGALESAQCLSQIAMSLGYSNPFIKSIEQQQKLKEASLSFTDKQMQSCIIHGVGYHNGGLCMKDRNLVEGLFLKGDLQILCTTNTLAHGINLPAHTVVVKSTQYFNREKGLYMEYELSMVLQMCGRAGRPPFDDAGTVIIMTRRDTVHLYENLLNGCEMVESQLLSCAMEHLTAEIVQLIISDICLAIEWLKYSYLYVRIKKNPENYGIERGIPHECLEKHMQEICVKKIKELSEHGMIWTDDDGFLLKPSEPGILMTKFYLKFNTMKLIVNAPGSCSVEDVLRIISHSEELSWIQLRRNEKKLLNDVNSDKEGRLRFHVLSENGKRKKRVQTREEKIFVLANDCLTGDPLVHDLSLNQDMNSICMSGCRIAKCIKQCFIYRKNYKGTITSTLLAKCLHHRLWENSPYLLKQLPGIGMVTAKALHSAGINSFESLGAADPRKIEIITGRKYPFGNHVKESLLLLPPKVEIKMEEAECKKPGKLKLIVTLNRTCLSATSTKHHYADMLVGSDEDNMILFHEKIRAEEFPSPYVVTVLVSCPQNARVTLKADLIFEEYVGLDVHEKLVVTKGNNSIMPRGPLCEDSMPYALPEEIYLIEDDQKSSSKIMCDETLDLDNLRVNSSMPSFDLLQEETGKGLDALTPEPSETECKTKSIEIIFEHIRKKSKSFPTLLTSKVMDYACQPLVLRRDTTKKQGFDVEADLNHIILIDSEPSEVSQELSLPVSFLTETERAVTTSNLNSVLKPQLPYKLSPTCHQPGFNKPCSDSLEIVQTVGCKRSFSNESNPISDSPICSQGHSVSLHDNLRAESFLGFKSVFSFL
ncbi:ATP-dependent DNA helicase MER3 homolog [Musa acuminata AAA Group]|uniref:ATP-dependent DNA helicase MER3 homolog n=1 Tax=Musa acuminata AAA Group TaxID=214697 RepID=UPI0031E06DFD